jgi:WD40 repeat protein/tRNA A-37 threonylcarbamoyl transferase component Bud32
MSTHDPRGTSESQTAGNDSTRPLDSLLNAGISETTDTGRLSSPSDTDPSEDDRFSLGTCEPGVTDVAQSVILPEAHVPPAISRPSPIHVPGYALLEKLDEGGMGEVWKARQIKLNRVVALKMVLGGHRAGRKDLIRFLAEAEAVAAVKHPHVVQVYEFGDADGRPFLAMEYLSGGSLTRRLKEIGRFPPKAAAELVGTLAGAVHVAHDLGIVHRDLKPGNVLYDENGEPKVTDFGLAKRAGGSDLTETRAVMGTPAYMAPEQARGDTKFVGPQADVYSLGVILYECLVGIRPFHAADPFVLLRNVVEQEPEPPRKRVPGLPRDIELICLKCLAKEPLERYQTAGALAIDLARFAAGEPVSVRAAGMVERMAKWARRKPTLAAAYTFGLMTLLFGGLGGVAFWQWGIAEEARKGEKTQRGIAEKAQGKAEKAQKNAETSQAQAERDREKFERFDYGRTMQVALQEFRERNFGAAEALLERTREDLRGWEWHYVHRLCHPDLVPFRRPHTGPTARSVAFGPDGTRIVAGNAYEDRRELRDRDQQRVLVRPTEWPAWEPVAFSPDGSRVVTGYFLGGAKVWDARRGECLHDLTTGAGTFWYADLVGRPQIWDAETGRVVGTLQRHTGLVNGVAFSPDGARIVTSSMDRTAKIWDAKTGAEIRSLNGEVGIVSTAAFSSDGSRIVTAGLDNSATIWDANHGVVVLTLNGHTEFVNQAAFSRDGSRVVTASSDRTAKVWDANRGVEVRTFRGHTLSVSSAAFSPNGARIVTASLDKTAKIWDVKTGAEIRTLDRHTAGLTSAVFSPDGTQIATVSDDDAALEATATKGGSGSAYDTIRVWDAEPPPDFLAGEEEPRFDYSLTRSPDGSREVNWQGSNAVVSSNPGNERLLTLVGHTGRVSMQTYSPDGKRIVTASIDGTARVWDAVSGAEVLTLKGHKAPLSSALFTRDGTRIVTRSTDDVVKVWDARPVWRQLPPPDAKSPEPPPKSNRQEPGPPY